MILPKRRDVSFATRRGAQGDVPVSSDGVRPVPLRRGAILDYHQPAVGTASSGCPRPERDPDHGSRPSTRRGRPTMAGHLSRRGFLAGLGAGSALAALGAGGLPRPASAQAFNWKKHAGAKLRVVTRK